MERNLKARTLTATVAEDDKGISLVKVQFRAWDTEVTIYRMEAPGFIFDFHYGEYFDDFSVKDTVVIYRGEVSRETLGNWCTYEDYDVELHKVYLYWVATASEPEKVTGPAMAKVRERAAWWPFEKVLRETYRLESEFDNVRTVMVGETVQHKPLVALCAGNPEKTVALVGAVHAGEGGPEVWMGVVRNILENHPELLKEVGIAVLPSVNADEREKMVCGTPWYIRRNTNGVDLNRNFDMNWEEVSTMYNVRSDDPRATSYRGVRPASEPETQAVVQFLELIKPQVCLCAHSMSSIPGDVLLCSRVAEGDAEYLERAETTAKVYKEGYRRELHWPVKTPMVYGTTQGSIPAYAYSRGIVCFDLEHANGIENNPFDDSKRDLTTKEMLDLCVRSHTDGMIALLEYLGKQEREI